MSDETPEGLIGSYKPPEEKQPPPNSPAGSMAQGIQEDLAAGVKETEETSAKTEHYSDILKENDITEDEAASIVDDMLTQGFYLQRVDISKKISVDFRTRTHADYLRYHNELEVQNPRFEEERNEIALRFCLAGSLARFKDTEFSFPKPEDSNADEMTAAFTTRLQWIERQPERLIALLASKLNRFDTRVSVVMSEGVVENF